jgi:hypothetical protein
MEPAVDRHRGFTAVLVHLRSGPPPSPDGRRYNRLAAGEPVLDAVTIERLKAAASRPSPAAARGLRRPAPKRANRPLP